MLFLLFINSIKSRIISLSGYEVLMDRIVFKNTGFSEISNYFNLYMLISFLGWLWETLYMYFLSGEVYDRGFLLLPFCPIYGTVLLSAYFLIGTVKEGRGILTHVGSLRARVLMYFLISFMLPTVAELLVGAFFLNVFDIRLWDYSSMKYNTSGHIALGISLLWGIAIFLFMNFLFLKIKSIVFKINERASKMISLILAAAIFADLAVSVVGVV